MGLEPLLAGVGLCQAREVEAWRDGMALGISSGCTVPFRVEVLVEGCWFFVPPPLTLPCEGSLWLLLRIKAIRGGLHEYSLDDCVAAQQAPTRALAPTERMQSGVWVSFKLKLQNQHA